MLNKLVAYTLLFLCSLNAFAISEEANSLFDETRSSQVSLVSASIDQANGTNAAINFHHDSHSDDCTPSDCAAHQCHLGHCQFVAEASSLVHAVTVSELSFHSDYSFPSVQLSGPIKPPRA